MEGDPGNDGAIFAVRLATYDLAAKMLSDTSAGGILLSDWIDEASFAERPVSPLNECGHDFSSKTLLVHAFLDPRPSSGESEFASSNEAMPIHSALSNLRTTTENLFGSGACTLFSHRVTYSLHNGGSHGINLAMAGVMHLKPPVHLSFRTR